MKERIISIVITTSLVVLLIGCSHKKEHIIDTWSKYEGNPIIGDEDTGTLFDADVIKLENGLLRMYLSWRPQRAIAICESENGKDWTELQIVLTNDGETGWEDDINRSSVVYHGDIYYMWYTGYGCSGITEDVKAVNT
ncbi:MAG: hypothetical protein MJZ11_06675 [Lachnospiraceae bacterium]|nr:hypothetical protein [Lachnospiraceae bacterium]